MINRLCKIIALFFLLFYGFSASAKGALYHYSQKIEKKSTISAKTAHHNPLSLEYLYNNTAVPLINLQQHRGAHSFHYFFTSFNVHTIRVKYLNLICGYGSSELSRFRKLILYPFHAFW